MNERHTRTYRTNKPRLWFEVPGFLADQHRKELTIFTTKVQTGDVAHFSALTYQELFARMVPFVGQDNWEYMAYLRERYLNDSAV